MYQPSVVAKFREVFFEVYYILLTTFPSKNTSLNLAKTDGLNI